MTLDLVEAAECLDVEAGGGLLRIGEMARASGLSISALRFYDGAGVLAPALVDPDTGYRWYAEHQLPAARLVAGLRRIGMPLAEVTRLLDLRGADPAAVPGVLDAHLRRLEDGLADARREVSRLRALFAASGQSAAGAEVRLTTPSQDLAAAVDAVRFAVGADPGKPMLSGVHFEIDGDVLRLVATDRYRMAVATVDTRAGGGLGGTVDAKFGGGVGGAADAEVGGVVAPAVTAPVGFVDEARELLTDGGPAALTLGYGVLSLRVRDRRISGVALQPDFPDYRRLLRSATSGPDRRRVTVDVAGLRERLATGATRTVVRQDDGARCPVSVLTVDASNTLAVAGIDTPAGPATPPDLVRVGVNRDFLLDALAAAGSGRLVLELDGPIRPLAVRRLDDRAFSILMPVRV